MPKDYKNSVLLDCYGQLLTEKQKNIMDLYYNDDFSLSEISESQCITRQGALHAIKRSEAQLKEFEQKLMFVQKVAQLRKAAVVIRELDCVVNTKEFKEFFEYIDNLL